MEPPFHHCVISILYPLEKPLDRLVSRFAGMVTWK